MLDWFPPHKAGLHLTHNEHKNCYISVEEHCQFGGDLGHEDFVDEEDFRRACETDELWELQWYPDTPVGFNLCRASSLDRLIDLVKKVSGE